MIKLTPRTNHVLVEREERETKSAGGLFLPDDHQHLRNKGTIVAMGPDVEGLEVGDFILHKEYTGTPITFSGTEQLLIVSDDIMAVLYEDEDEST